MGIIVQIMEDHLINAQICHLTETMETDLEMDLLATEIGIGGTMEIFLVLHRPKGKISYKITPTASLEVFNPTIPPSADLTTDLRLVLHPTNKSSPKTIIRHHLMWSSSPQRMIPSTNCRISAR